MSSTRRLAAILAAEVAGYSRLTEADEEGTHARLRSLRHEVIEPSDPDEEPPAGHAHHSGKAAFHVQSKLQGGTIRFRRRDGLDGLKPLFRDPPPF